MQFMINQERYEIISSVLGYQELFILSKVKVMHFILKDTTT